MNDQTKEIWELLQASGIVLGEPPGRGDSSPPWFVKALLAFSGWLAAIFILGFIVAAFAPVFKNSGVASVIGVILIAGAFVLLRMPANAFVEHLGLAASLAGQVLLVYAIFDFADHNEITAWLLMAIFQAVLVWFMPNFVHCVVSALVAAIAVSMALNEMEIPYLAAGIVLFGASYCWLNEFRYPQQMEKIRAMGYGLVLALVALKGMTRFGYSAFAPRFLQHHGSLPHPWVGGIIIGAVTVYVVWRLLQYYGQPMLGRLSITTLLATLLVCAVSMNVQGIAVGMVIVCLGFWSANRVLLGLGMVSLLFYISSYYYLLDTTLLDKSLSLLVVGLILFVVRWLMQKIIPAANEVQHA